MVKAVTALLVKHDAVLNARIDSKEKLVDMQDDLVELYAEFFSRSSFPISAISLPADKYDTRDPKRAEYFTPRQRTFYKVCLHAAAHAL